MNRRRLLLLAPLGLAVAGGAAFFAMLRGEQAGTFDPRGVPSQLIGKKPPPFLLPGLNEGDLAAATRPLLVNFFASWCEPCIEEAAVLLSLKQSGVTVYGIAYKDKPEDTARFLARNGNPYERIGADRPGRVAIDWGVTGVPETYLIAPGGTVRWRFVGPLTREAVTAQVTPLLRQYA